MVPAMRLQPYLDATGTTYSELAAIISKQVGRTVSPGTIRAIGAGGGCRSDVAHAIIEASKGAPAPDGATVTLADLVRASAR